jgi:hypothetical protein
VSRSGKTNHQNLRTLKKRRGQTTLEYVLITVVTVMAFQLLIAIIRNSSIGKGLTRSLTEEYSAVYQLGHPEAKPSEGGSTPRMHPRDPRDPSSGNFRIFINPR